MKHLLLIFTFGLLVNQASATEIDCVKGNNLSIEIKEVTGFEAVGSLTNYILTYQLGNTILDNKIRVHNDSNGVSGDVNNLITPDKGKIVEIDYENNTVRYFRNRAYNTPSTDFFDCEFKL